MGLIGKTISLWMRFPPWWSLDAGVGEVARWNPRWRVLSLPDTYPTAGGGWSLGVGGEGGGGGLLRNQTQTLDQWGLGAF